MITEGVVALIWATVAMFFFYDSPNPGYATIAGGEAAINDAPSIVHMICNDWLGVFGGILAMLGVVAAPITSGDTALRSCRLIIADFLHLEQRSIRSRLYVCVPLFAITMALLIWQMADPGGFKIIWSWFGWSNQTLAVFTLWAITVYLVRNGKNYFITLIPALFMTVVCTTFFFAEKAFSLTDELMWVVAAAALVVSLVWFGVWYKKHSQTNSK
jgi:carbon starvation protein CstA